MFILYADKNRLAVRRKEPVTSGSVGVYPVQFEFSPDWNELDRTAVFRAGTETRSVLLTDGPVNIPWEVLQKPGSHLQAGVYGTHDGEIVLPTVWSDLGVILEGVASGEITKPPTPGLYEQLIEMLKEKADALLLDGAELQLLAGDYPLSTVVLPTGGGEGGVSDHRQLSGRDAENQHPMEAITGLLDAIPRPMTADELREILIGGTGNGSRK